MVAWRYEFYFLVLKTILFSLAATFVKYYFRHKIKVISLRHHIISAK